MVFADRKTMHWFQQTYTPKVEDRLKPEISPIYHTDFKHLPPVLYLQQRTIR